MRDNVISLLGTAQASKSSYDEALFLQELGKVAIVQDGLKIVRQDDLVTAFWATDPGLRQAVDDRGLLDRARRHIRTWSILDKSAEGGGFFVTFDLVACDVPGNDSIVLPCISEFVDDTVSELAAAGFGVEVVAAPEHPNIVVTYHPGAAVKLQGIVCGMYYNGENWERLGAYGEIPGWPELRKHVLAMQEAWK